MPHPAAPRLAVEVKSMRHMKQVGKQEAQYQSHPRGIARCERCSMFQPPGGCSKVAGTINRRGWSKYFEWKSPQEHARARREAYDSSMASNLDGS